MSLSRSEQIRLRFVLVDLFAALNVSRLDLKTSGKGRSAAAVGQQQLVSLCGCEANRGRQIFSFWQADPVCVYLCAA